MRIKGLTVFVLAFCTAALPTWAQQNQSSSPYGPADEPAASSGPAAPQQGGDAGAAPPQPQGAPAQFRVCRRGSCPVPPTLTLPAGTRFQCAPRNGSRAIGISGDTFSATSISPWLPMAGSWRAADKPYWAGSTWPKASQGNGVSRLGVEITELTLVDGEQIPVSTRMQQVAPSPYSQYPGRSAATVATTTAVGAIIGAAVGRGVGAAIGAGLGATTGVPPSVLARARHHDRSGNVAYFPIAGVHLGRKGPVAAAGVAGDCSRDQDAYGNTPRRNGPPWGPGYAAPYYYGYYGGYPYCGWYCYPGPYVGWGWGVGYFRVRRLRRLRPLPPLAFRGHLRTAARVAG